jgi:hypothetical protein
VTKPPVPGTAFLSRLLVLMEVCWVVRREVSRGNRSQNHAKEVDLTGNPGEVPAGHRRKLKGRVMNSKYNELVDNMAIRVSLNTVAFTLWLVMAVGLLELAVKV